METLYPEVVPKPNHNIQIFPIKTLISRDSSYEGIFYLALFLRKLNPIKNCYPHWYKICGTILMQVNNNNIPSHVVPISRTISHSDIFKSKTSSHVYMISRTPSHVSTTYPGFVFHDSTGCAVLLPMWVQNIQDLI